MDRAHPGLRLGAVICRRRRARRPGVRRRSFAPETGTLQSSLKAEADVFAHRSQRNPQIIVALRSDHLDRSFNDYPPLAHDRALIRFQCALLRQLSAGSDVGTLLEIWSRFAELVSGGLPAR